MMELQPIRRPVGMTILLVLSFLNALFNIFSAPILYFGTPMMNEMLASGAFEESLKPFLATMSEADVAAIMDRMRFMVDLNPLYYLFNFVLYIGSMVGVVKMFKLQRQGFHWYAIAQFLILINSVFFIYSKQPENPFFSEFLTTVMLILIYHLFLKRIELMQQQSNKNQDPYV